MGTCYICGKEHVDYRRSVHTGSSYRTGVSSRGSVHTSVTNSTGIRTVCAKCAFDIDYSSIKNKGMWGIKLGTFIIFISIIITPFKPFIGIPGIIMGIIIYIFPRREGKKEAELWYNENVEKYVDEVDIKNRLYQLAIEQAQNEKRKIQEEEYRNEQKKLIEDKQQVRELGKIFSERIKQEKDLLITKIQVYNNSFQKIEIQNSDEIKKYIKELEEQENDCEKTLKKINKICDDYIKQCSNSLSTREIIEKSINNIEKLKGVFLNLINAFISRIKSTENNVLKSSLTISNGNISICENESIIIEQSSIENLILLIENKEEKNNPQIEEKSDENKKKFSYMRDYIKEQLQRNDVEEIQKMESMYFNTSSLAYFKDIIPSFNNFVSLEEYKKALASILEKI